MSSLVPTVPVNLDGQDIEGETFIKNRGVISVGSCKFRFIYRKGAGVSPLREDNGTLTPDKVR